MFLGAVVLATGLIAADVTLDMNTVERWPLVFGAGAAGSRGLLTAVAGSMITVAGVVFSITIVALALTSSQYTSRVLRNFMSDRINQSVLGVFVGIFAYCLIVLRTIRGGDEGAFVPSIAVLGGLILAFVGIAFLIYFIHHISMSIQASSIVAAATQETIAAIDDLFPESLDDFADEDEDRNLTLPCLKNAVASQKTGYIQGIDDEALFVFASKHETVIRMEFGIGEFVIEGSPLLYMGDLRQLEKETINQINAIYVISRQRTVHQDPAFGIRQIVDIALKALSPGINDTTTAIICVDYLSAILVRLSSRRIQPRHRMDHGKLRLIARGLSFKTLLAEAFDQIRQNAEGNVAIMIRMLGAFQTISNMTTNINRQKALYEQAQKVAELGQRTIQAPYDRARFNNHLVAMRDVIGSES